MAEILQFNADTTFAQKTPSPDEPSDREQRRFALDIRSSCIVEAPAGSGKTGLLLQRFLKLLAEGGVSEPEEVLAITFTRKATTELRERILEQLHAAASSTPLGPEAGDFERETRSLAEEVLLVDARLGWRLLDQPQRLRIQTIDSLCGEIARMQPLLSGSGADRPIEDARPLYHEAARRTLRQLGGVDTELNNALRTVLLHRDGNLDDCGRLLARMLQQRDQWSEFVPLHAETLTEEYLEQKVRPRLERSLESVICSTLHRATSAMPPGLLERLTSLASRLASESGHNGASPIAFCVDRRNPPQAHADDLDHWRALIHLLLKPSDDDWRARHQSRDLNFEVQREDAALLARLVGEIQTEELRDVLRAVRRLPAARYPDDQWGVVKALFRLLRHALAQLAVVFSETSQCDFTEIALAARAALTDGTADLANTPGARLSHLLVDEMQDTSSSQYGLLELLTRSWDGHSQTLFLVGDPKQSIYLFRQARVERFLRTMRERRLGEIHLVPLQLIANFRSQGTLVEGFNHTFSQVFTSNSSAGTDILDVPFVHAEPSRKPSNTGEITWHATILGDGLRPEETPSLTDLRAAHYRSEARSIRRIIEEWHARPLPPGRPLDENGQPKPWSIAVLVRARNHLDAIIAELARDHGKGPIPFRAVEIDPLAERSEVLDVLALTRALLHPADRVAWLAVLHAPWCGLGLADLLTLTGDGSSADAEATIAELLATRREFLSPEGQRLLDRAWPMLIEAVSSLGHTSFAVHVERTWRSLGADAPLTHDRLTNVRRFLQVVGEVEADSGRVDLKRLEARLADLYAEPRGGEHAVQLLTIHKSKGLEFDVVIVPGLERSPNRSQATLLNWVELDSADADSAHILLAPIWSRGDDADPFNQWLNRIRLARERAEVKRLAYVACTRAREALHLFAACQRNNDQRLRLPAVGTLLHACWPAAQLHFDRLSGSSAPNLAVVTRHAEPWIGDSPATSMEDSGLALAASAEPIDDVPRTVRRLPLDFSPLARFDIGEDHRLPYVPASLLPCGASFDRPEGSFGVRAFGNVVHRFLQLLSVRLERNNDPDALLAELPTWEPRLVASLRGEGLALSPARREAVRALSALQNSLTDAVGRWILSPHVGAANERSVVTSGSVLRADRSFWAGERPAIPGETCLWIVDFKTTEQGSRSLPLFEQEEFEKYRLQLQRYAEVSRALSGEDHPVRLGLYYPLVSLFLQWEADGFLSM